MMLFNSSTRKTTTAACAAMMITGLLVLAAPALAVPTTYIVDPTAADPPPLGGPYRTIQRAVEATGNGSTLTIRSGDTILVKAGTYLRPGFGNTVDMDLKNTTATTDAQRILITADPSAPIGSVIVQASGSSGVAFNLTRCSFITIRGFDMTGTGTGPGLKGVSFGGGGSSNNDITIERNRIYSIAGTGSGSAAGIDINTFNVRTWVVNNLIRNNGRSGVVVDSTGPTYVVNNTIYANQWNGVSRNTTAVLFLVNNLIVGNGTAASGGSGNCQAGLCQTGVGTAATVTLKNNMFYDSGVGGDIAAPLSTLDATDSGNYTTTGVGTGIVGCTFSPACNDVAPYTDILVSPGTGDFKLKPCTSPAIDKGLNSFINGAKEWVPTNDQKGTARPQNGRCVGSPTVDIGLDEVVPVVPTVSPPATANVECGSSTAPASTGTATAASSCTGASLAVSFSDSSASGVCPIKTVITRTWSATDCGGSTNQFQTINVRDTTAPMIDLNGPGMMIVELECGGTYFELGATATDACDVADPVVITGSVNPNLVGDYTRFYNAVDSCGNVATTKTRTIHVRDHVAPTFTQLPGNLTDLECEGAAGVYQTNTRVQDFLNAAMASDTCDTSVPVTYIAPNPFPFGPSIVTFMAVDDSGNPIMADRTVTVVDTTGPTFDVFPNDQIPLQCADEVPASDLGSVHAIDLCGSATVSVLPDASNGLSGCPGSALVITRTYRAVDENFPPNVTDRDQVFTIIDDTKPQVNSLPATVAAVTGQCDADVPSTATTIGQILAVTTDNCDATPSAVLYSQTDNSGAGCGYSPLIITRTYRVSDDCGNPVDVPQTITIADDTAPTIEVNGPANLTIECGSPYYDQGATAHDNCDSDIAATQGGETVDIHTPDFYMIDYMALDGCGNVAVVAHRTVEVRDTIPPAFANVPVNLQVECNAAATDAAIAAFVHAPTASDLCDTLVEVTNDAPVSFNYGVTTVTWTATDDSNNHAYASRTVEVRDTTPPSLTIPGDANFQCASAIPAAVAGAASATDTCGSVTVTVSDASIGTGCNGSPRIVTRTFRAEDSHSNVTISAQTLTAEDTVAPVVTLNGAAIVDVECGSAYSESGASALDNCAGGVLVTTVGTVDNHTPADYDISYSADDGCGNSATIHRTVRVRDNTAPTFSGVPADIYVECEGSSGVSAAGNAAIQSFLTGVSASDACAGTLPVGNDSPGVFGFGPTTVHFTASDGNGHDIAASARVIVRDTHAPLFDDANFPADQALQCVGEIPAFNTGPITASDNCAASVAISFVIDTNMGGTGCAAYPLVIKRTYKADDGRGNSSLRDQTFTIADTTMPSIVPIAQHNVECYSDALAYAPDTALVQASDNCDPHPSVAFVSDAESGGNGCAGSPRYITRTYKATDACGNEQTVQQVIKVENTMPMTIDVPEDKTVEANYLNLDLIIPANTNGLATAPDRCGDDASITKLDTTEQILVPNELTPEDLLDTVLVDTSCPTVIKRTWTATYDCGSISDDQFIYIQDTLNPAFTAFPVDATIDEGESTDPSETGMPGATDNSGSAAITQTDVVTPTLITRTWKAKDACGNFVTQVQLIHITLAPTDCSGDVVTMAQNVTINMNPFLTGGSASVTISPANPALAAELAGRLTYYHPAGPVENWKVILDMGDDKLLVKSGATLRVSAVPPTTNNQKVPALVIKGTCDLEVEAGGSIASTAQNQPSGRLSILMGKNVLINGEVVNETNGTNGAPGGITVASEHGYITTGSQSSIRTYGSNAGPGIDIMTGCGGPGDITIMGIVDAVYKSGNPTVNVVALDGKIIIDGNTFRGIVTENGTAKRMFTGVKVRSTHNPQPGFLNIQASGDITVFGNTIKEWQYGNLGAVAIATGSNGSVGGIMDVRSTGGNIIAYDRAFDNANRFNTNAKINLTADVGMISLNTTPGALNSVKKIGQNYVVDPKLMDVVSTQAGRDGFGGINRLYAGSGVITLSAYARVMADHTEPSNGGDGLNKFLPVVVAPSPLPAPPIPGRILPVAGLNTAVPPPAPLFGNCGQLGVSF